MDLIDPRSPPPPLHGWIGGNCRLEAIAFSTAPWWLRIRLIPCHLPWADLAATAGWGSSSSSPPGSRSRARVPQHSWCGQLPTEVRNWTAVPHNDTNVEKMMTTIESLASPLNNSLNCHNPPQLPDA
ncbi:hypothetical protein ACQJBY_070585 [Aegilops geniculata]